MIELSMPRQICNPQRKLMNSKKDYYKFINNNIGHCNLFTTVYNYSEYDNYKPNFESAIIDRIWFDFDLETILADKTVIRNDCYSTMKKLHDWCLKHDYKHICRYTGSGFDTTIFTMKDCFIQNKKDCIWNVVDDIEKELGIETDIKTKGDIARIHRVTNTFNFKSKAQRFAIPLTEEMIQKGHEGIREIAKKQQFHNNHVIGSKLMDIRKQDYKNHYTEEIELDSDYEIGDCKIEDLCDAIPICIRHLLLKGSPNYEERRIIIVGLRELAYTENETKQLLYKYLDSHKFKHCVYEEGQLRHLYSSHKIIFPKQTDVIRHKACPCKLGEYCENANFGCLNYMRRK